jgi:hypothetical protein
VAESPATGRAPAQVLQAETVSPWVVDTLWDTGTVTVPLPVVSLMVTDPFRWIGRVAPA